MPSNEIFEQTKKEGFNDRTLQRARKELGIKCFQEFDEEGNNSWHWRLPKQENKQLKMPNLNELEAKARADFKKMRERMGMV
jgi:hypothetical protein